MINIELSRPQWKTSGFTLIEILMSMAIIATMALVIATSIQRSLKNKVKIQSQLDDGSRVRDALKIVEKDISLAYNSRDLEKELFEKLARQDPNLLNDGNTSTSATSGAAGGTQSSGKGTSATGSTGTNSAPFDSGRFEAKWKKDNPYRESPATQFKGDDSSMYFATFNAPRISSEIAQADFVYVGYFLTGCRSPKEELRAAKCLMRAVNPWVDGDPTKTKKAIILLEYVTEFTLRYFGEGKQDWVSSWASVGGDGATTGRYPSMVEVNVTVEKTISENANSKRKLSYQLVVPIRWSNNPLKQSQSNATNQ